MRELSKTRQVLGSQVAAGYQAGASMAELAQTYACSEGTIRNILNDLNIQPRKRGRPKKDKPQETQSGNLEQTV